MQTKQIYQIYEELEKINLKESRKIICNNIKKYRLELYNKYKQEYNKIGYENPYSAINVSDYLNVSYEYYRRLESKSDTNKKYNLFHLIKLSYILNKKIDDFLIE